tara:strand:+ start:114 stop:365 length:252 start_codon:yes stop_codon:yes gene_type:complete
MNKRQRAERAATQARYDLVDRLGAAILASDRSPAAVRDIMRGQWGIFTTMDRRDGARGVPEWHPYLRRARNGPGFFDALNDRP